MQDQTGKELELSRTELGVVTKQAQEQVKRLENTQQFYNKPQGKYTSSRYLGIDLDKSSSTVTQAMDEISKSLAKGNKYTQDYTASTGKMITTIEKGSGIIEKYQTTYNPISGNAETSLYKVTQNSKPILSYFDDLGEKFKSLSQYLVGAFGFDALITGVRSGVTSIRELDTAMTELKKTSTATSEEYASFSKQARSDAKEIGSTTTQITSSAADFSRLGYSLEESSTLAKTTGILKNVSEFESIDAATEAMISMMKAYDFVPSESMKLVDKMNLIGNKFAISTDGIATALQTSGSALRAAGNDFDKSVALVTAANSVIQDPSQVGAGLRTIALRLRGTSAETLTEMGEDTEGLIETTSKLNSQIKSLTSVNGKMGVSILDINGNYRDTYDILLDIASVWDDIAEQDRKDGQNRQAALLEMIAGKNRSNIAASILQNPSLLSSVYGEVTTNYEGSAQNELNTYLDSIDAKVIKLQESWAQLWQSDSTTSIVKDFLGIGDTVLKFVDFLGAGNVLSSGLGIFGAKSLNLGGINLFSYSS